MSEKQKVLICGDVEGQFKFFYKKVDTINKKNGPFDFLLCVGNFFGENNIELEPFKNGSKSIPVPTYIIGPNRESDVKHYPDLNGSEICQNLTYLGRRGLYTASSGLKIAYLSGIEENSSELKDYSFNAKDVESVRNTCLKGQPSYRGVDFLLTSPWPEGITNLDPKQPEIKYKGSKLIAWLSTHIKPRYHLCALENVHYERPPYRNQSKTEDNMEIATRFMSLASVGNSKKEKWLYALNLTPVDRSRLSELIIKTTDETSSPYSKSLLSADPLNQNKSTEMGSTQFFFDMDSSGEKRKNKRSDQPNKKAKFEFDQTKCWFCLSSPEVSKHLVISVGSEIYLALAKGGVVDDHFLILPVTHHQSLSILPESVAKEMKLYKEAVTKYYATTDRVPVFFERNFKTSHCQLQAIPVHKNQASALKETFEEVAECNNFSLTEIPRNSQLQQIAQQGMLYFYVELPDGDKLYHRIKKEFPLQFGREVLVSDRILDINDRADWRDCQMDKDKETELAMKIRKAFQPFDVDV
ncbi:CWF19-like protein 1 [Leptopilina heterotoma]|uniref:CWF19-like protein 1 n=1 Tax=Leptopilina heterotoma TaxID=63436 RepID=UPI001CA98443|nr:CWF19-like protein 1 [Leptopilina heterotoma]